MYESADEEIFTPSNFNRIPKNVSLEMLPRKYGKKYEEKKE